MLPIAGERRFTGNAAHELRTLLTAIKTHLQVMRLASANPRDAERGVLRLQQTLNQLLLLARLDGQLETTSLQGSYVASSTA